jgi:hypothetical protein
MRLTVRVPTGSGCFFQFTRSKGINVMRITTHTPSQKTDRSAHVSIAIVAAFWCIFLFAQPAWCVQHGPGLGKTTFTQSELYKPVFQFPVSVVGDQMTQAAMHNGYLIIPAKSSPGGRISVWNVSNPRAPVLVSNTLDQAIAKTHGMSFFGDLVTIRSDGGTMLWDLQNTAAPRKISSFRGQDTAIGCHYTAPYIYTGGEGPSTNLISKSAGGLTVWDATNPLSPKQVKYLHMPQLVGFPCGAVNVVGNLMVVSGSYDANAGHVLLDISNPVNPIILDVIRRSGPSTYTALINGGRLYNGSSNIGSASARNLSIYDLRDPLRITLLRDVPLPVGSGGLARAIWIQDNFAHAADPVGNKYMKVDIANFTIAASPLMPGKNSEFAVPCGNWAFVGQSIITSERVAQGAFVVPNQTLPDNRGPEVNMVNPLDGAVKRALTSRVGITLTDQIDTRSVNSNTFIIRPVGGLALNGKYTNQQGILNFFPNSPLLANTTYEVIVPVGGVKDVSGNAVSVPFRSVFSTGSAVTSSSPTITAQPANQSVIAGQAATFSVAASGTAPLAYQWQKGNLNIPGATGASYTTPATTITDTGAAFRVIVSNALGSATSASATLTVTAAPTTQTNGAAFVSQSVPAAMNAGQAYPVSVTMLNSGTSTWTAAAGYRLGSQNPQDNVTWGMERVLLASGDAIAPGQSKTFTFNATAPATAKIHNFQWRMVREGVMWFGALSTNVGVTVSAGTTVPQQTPYGGVAWAIPGTIQAENFDVGGEGVAYHDVDVSNIGGAYRTGGVDLFGGHDGGTIIGATKAGEWLEYTVNVAVAGNYQFEARVSSIDSGGKFHVEFNGVNKSDTITMPAYTGTMTWTTLTRTVSLTAGQQVMRIALDGNGSNNAEVVNLNHVRLTAAGMPTGTG